MKKLFALLMAIIMLFSLAACGNKTSNVICPNCKAEVTNDSLFCSNCGTNLNSEETETNTENSSTNEKTSSNTDETTSSVEDTTVTESTPETTQHTHQYSTKKNLKHANLMALHSTHVLVVTLIKITI